jgi:glutathione S-transferase
MKLYYAPGACSLAPHIVLREADRHFELDRVDLATHRTASGVDYRTINPKGYVPALELDDAGSEVLTECAAVLQYIADLVPDRRLVPANGTFARYHLQEWLSFISSEIHKQLGPLWHRGTPERYAAVLRGKVGERFGYLQDVLADHAFVMGETFTVADAYLFTLLQWCGKLGIDLQRFPALDDYETRVSQRPAVQGAMAVEGLASRHAWRRTA